jgi:hypothetical protein
MMTDRADDIGFRDEPRDPVGDLEVHCDRLLDEQAEPSRDDALLGQAVRIGWDAHVHSVHTGIDQRRDVRNRPHPMLGRELTTPSGVEIGHRHQVDIVKSGEQPSVAGGNAARAHEPDPTDGHTRPLQLTVRLLAPGVPANFGSKHLAVVVHGWAFA